MNTDSTNDYFRLAYDYVNDTASPIYLTGKAGTGKTTFLKYVKQHCTKSLVVVAPTGVAAINAGGVTMHSFFQLPFSPYVPNAHRGFGLNNNLVDKTTLLRNLRFSNNKRKLMEELQLLIIDEVSMLRSDMLDAIDTVLRAIRKKNKPFGGVQVLFIGDLYQLPPVVKDNEKEIFEEYYQSPFFFHAKVFEETQPVFIELKKVYRQTDQRFIDLLNKIRDQNLAPADFELLNQRFMPDFQPEDKRYITLTSHNYKADAINNDELQKLPAKLIEYRGKIVNDFNDKQLPTELVLRLKEGAQIMFIRNDSSPEKKYYNGKIGIVHKLHSEKLEIKFPDSDEILDVEKETWDNITYAHNETTHEIEEKLLGQFIQFPIRLAWAITIHKSQGLTFNHAIIDAGQSFAAGQVYVALSRCTSLEGIVLHSYIGHKAIHSDHRIFDFNLRELPLTDIENQLRAEKFQYQASSLTNLFQWRNMEDTAREFYELTSVAKAIPPDLRAVEFCGDIIEKTKAQKEVADKFCIELESLFNHAAFNQDTSAIKVRLRKAIPYFVNKIHNELIEPLRAFSKQLLKVSRIKKYFASLLEIEELWWHKIEQLQRCSFEHEEVVTETFFSRKSEPGIAVPPKKAKGQSAKESLAYFLSGKTIAEIAEIRNLAQSTIEGHLAEFVKTGELDILRIMSFEEVEKVRKAYETVEYFSTTDMIPILNNAFSHGQIRMAVNYLLYKNEISEKPVKPRVVTDAVSI